jgi:hypothetical protein
LYLKKLANSPSGYIATKLLKLQILSQKFGLKKVRNTGPNAEWMGAAEDAVNYDGKSKSQFKKERLIYNSVQLQIQ